MSARFRTGSHQVRNIYRRTAPVARFSGDTWAGDDYLGAMFTDNLGRLAVHSLNLHACATPESHAEAPRTRDFVVYHRYNVISYHAGAERQIGVMFTEIDAELLVAALNFALWYDPSSFEDLEVPA